MPEDVQFDLVKSIPGLENAQMMRPGYAIEYDVVMPHQLRPTLETKLVSGLFTAGQTNGTSGYEEALGNVPIAHLKQGPLDGQFQSNGGQHYHGEELNGILHVMSKDDMVPAFP